MGSEITAQVGAPSPIPPRPEMLCLLLPPNGASPRWQSAFLSLDRKFVEDQQRRYAGSLLVTIPGDAEAKGQPAPAPPSDREARLVEAVRMWKFHREGKEDGYVCEGCAMTLNRALAAYDAAAPGKPEQPAPDKPRPMVCCSSDGNDETGDGSEARPFRTFERVDREIAKIRGGYHPPPPRPEPAKGAALEERALAYWRNRTGNDARDNVKVLADFAREVVREAVGHPAVVASEWNGGWNAHRANTLRNVGLEP